MAGDIEEQRGNPSAAVHSHQNAIALAPGEERYRLSLGAELLQYGHYDPAVTVFQQAAELFPNSARIYVGLGMAYYFMDKYDDSVAAFLRADKLDGGPGRATSYLGATQVDNAAGPIPAAVDAICDRADSHPTESAAATWCGALLFRKAYLADNQSAAPDVIRRLRVATKLAPGRSGRELLARTCTRMDGTIGGGSPLAGNLRPAATQVGGRSLPTQPCLPRSGTHARGGRTNKLDRGGER